MTTTTSTPSSLDTPAPELRVAFRHRGRLYHALVHREPHARIDLVAIDRGGRQAPAGVAARDDVPRSDPRAHFALTCVALASFEPEARYVGARAPGGARAMVLPNSAASTAPAPRMRVAFDILDTRHEALVYDRPLGAVAVARVARNGRRVFEGYAAHDGRKFDDVRSRFALAAVTCACFEALDPRGTRYLGPVPTAEPS